MTNARDSENKLNLPLIGDQEKESSGERTKKKQVPLFGDSTTEKKRECRHALGEWAGEYSKHVRTTREIDKKNDNDAGSIGCGYLLLTLHSFLCYAGLTHRAIGYLFGPRYYFTLCVLLITEPYWRGSAYECYRGTWKGAVVRKALARWHPRVIDLISHPTVCRTTNQNNCIILIWWLITGFRCKVLFFTHTQAHAKCISGHHQKGPSFGGKQRLIMFILPPIVCSLD